MIHGTMTTSSKKDYLSILGLSPDFDDKELFVDENWKINSKNMRNIITSDNSNLKIILSDIFPNKKIVIQNNNNGSQTIFLS